MLASLEATFVVDIGIAPGSGTLLLILGLYPEAGLCR